MDTPVGRRTPIVVSTGAQPLPQRVHWPHRRAVWVVVALIVAAGIAVGVDRALFAGAQETRSEFMQGTLDGLVTGPNRLAPGATAYVSGPHGTWVGAAGVANAKTGQPMQPDTRMRIESNSKPWVEALILQLAQQGTLTVYQTVDDWLPGLLRAHGSEITIAQLMSDSSGLIDDNDVWASPQAASAYIARVGDPKLRKQLLAAAARIRANPDAEVSPLLFVRLAAWQPLVSPPGTAYHHSNIGWNIVGLIAARAAGKPLPEFYRERIFQPLGLQHTAYDPQGPIAGPHAHGYALAANGTLTDMTSRHPGKGADGAIVTDAADEARFLTAYSNGKLFAPPLLAELWRGSPSGCGGRQVYVGSGAGDGFTANVVWAVAGSRVAVLLLNGRSPGKNDLERTAAAAANLYCAG
jgi:D-alanyl-D-alanine carboxypeptidase